MAAPQFVPVPPVERPRSYESPDHVPETWEADRPGELGGRQPQAPGLGFQGPDQGFGLTLANRFRGRLHLGAGESEDDAVQGCLAVALRRASLYGRAPMVHDLTLAFTVWGYLDPAPPADLVGFRRPLFAGVGHPGHHYLEWRRVADQVPEATLRMTHQAAAAAYPGSWRDLVGA